MQVKEAKLDTLKCNNKNLYSIYHVKFSFKIIIDIKLMMHIFLLEHFN